MRSLNQAKIEGKGTNGCTRSIKENERGIRAMSQKRCTRKAEGVMLSTGIRKLSRKGGHIYKFHTAMGEGKTSKEGVGSQHNLRDDG